LASKCLETLVHVLKVVTLPHTAHAGGRDRKPALPQLVGDAQLTEGGLLDGKRNDGILDLLWNAILQDRLLAADLLQRQLTAFLVKLLEAIKTVPGALRNPDQLRAPPRPVIAVGPRTPSVRLSFS
jgi:hypothetical protein